MCKMLFEAMVLAVALSAVAKADEQADAKAILNQAIEAHGGEAMKPYRPSGEGGVPWCAILDADGKKLADWDTPDGNMGYPTLPKEFDHLETILKMAAPKITDQQLADMRADLEQEAKKYGQH